MPIHLQTNRQVSKHWSHCEPCASVFIFINQSKRFFQLVYRAVQPECRKQYGGKWRGVGAPRKELNQGRKSVILFFCNSILMRVAVLIVISGL